jgi:hypothetical protein
MMGIVTLPAQIALAVSAQIDAWYLSRTVGLLRMALAAKRPLRRLLGKVRARFFSMLDPGVVAGLAFERHVMGNRLGPGDLSVASRA